MNNGNGGGNKKRPPDNRGAPSAKNVRGKAPNKKQAQKPTPSPNNRQQKKPQTGNRKNNAVSPEEIKSAKLKVKHEPKKSRMKQADVDRAAENTLLRNNGNRNSQANLRPLAPPKKPVNPYIKKLRRVLLGTVTILVLIAVCVGMSLTVFFKIDEISVEGETRYNKDDIIAASMINKGDNLLLCNTSQGVGKIQKKFAYIEDVSINKQLFNKIVINVTEAKPASVIESGGKYVVLSKSGKIIEINSKKTYDDIPAVLGAKLKNVKLSAQVQYKDENLKKYLDKLMEAIDEYKIMDIQTIDISNTSSIVLIKSNGFRIIVGTFENIEYKLQTAANILSRNVRENANGTLDVSLASADGGKSYLKIGDEVSEPSKKESSKSSSKTSSKKSENQSSAPTEESIEESSEEETAQPEEESYEEVQDDTDDYADNYYDDNYADDYDYDYADDTDDYDYTDDYYADDDGYYYDDYDDTYDDGYDYDYEDTYYDDYDE